MSTTKAFRGFIPVRKKGSNYNTEGVDVLPITSGGLCSNNLFNAPNSLFNNTPLAPAKAIALKPLRS